MRRPTITDLARESGVSVATVDRVLNGRLKVREDTARRVQEAAHRIGYYGANALRARLMADRPELRFALILQKPRHAFYQDFAAIFEERAAAVTTHRIRVSVSFAQSTLPAEAAQMIGAMAGKADAVAATGLDHHLVTAAVDALRSRGTPTFSLLSDFAQGVRESYIGVNNLKVGRAAAWLVSRLARRPGRVAVFIGGHRFHGHELRETGFRSYFREYAPEFELMSPQVNLETRELTYESTSELLERYPDLVGLYCAGGGMEGAIAALRDSRRPGEVALVVNELTAESREGLQDRTLAAVIATPLADLCTELVAMMIHGCEQGPAGLPGQRFLPFRIWTPESL